MTNQEKQCGCGAHEHEHDEHCGCGHDHEHHHHEIDEEVPVLKITLEDDTEMECYVLGIFEVRGKEYIALLPTEEEEVLLYEYNETEDGLELDTIEDDEIYELVVKAFEEASEEE